MKVSGRFRAVLVLLVFGATVVTLPAAASAALLTWTAPRLVDPEGGFSDVSCASTRWCAGVDDLGNVLISTDPKGPASTWRSSRVTRGHALWAITCQSKSLCVALDAHGDVITSAHPLRVGKPWRSVNIDKGSNPLDTASCPRVSWCVAMDGSGNVFTTTDPTGPRRAWRITHPQLGGAYQDFWLGLACPTTQLCVAVSDAGDILTSTHPAAGRRAWRLTDLSAISSGFRSISCPSVSLCVAAANNGSVITSSHPARGRHSWDAASIDAGNVITVDTSAQFSMTGMVTVSCASGSLCVTGDAVGNVLQSTRPTAGASAWTLTRVEPTPEPGLNGTAPGASGALSGVSCPSTSMCVGVDSGGNVLLGSGSDLHATSHREPRLRRYGRVPAAASLR